MPSEKCKLLRYLSQLFSQHTLLEGYKGVKVLCVNFRPAAHQAKAGPTKSGLKSFIAQRKLTVFASGFV